MDMNWPVISACHGLCQQFSLAGANDPLLLIGSPTGGDNIISFNQDVLVFKGSLLSGKGCDYTVDPARGVWVQMIKGNIHLNGQALSAGDGAAIEGGGRFFVAAQQDAGFLLFDLK